MLIFFIFALSPRLPVKSYYSIQIEDFFKSAFSVDCVVFGLDDEGLKVLLVERGMDPFMGQFALPGDLVYPNEEIGIAAKRVLHDLTSLQEVFLEQVHTFGEVDRHPLGRVVTIAYFSLIKIKNFKVDASSWASAASWHPVNDLPQLAFDHSKILDKCLQHLKSRVRMEPIGFELLPRKFTLGQLQNLYETILEEELDTRNFRKKVRSMDFIEKLDQKQKDVAHRPARLFKFNNRAYKKFLSNGFRFDL